MYIAQHISNIIENLVDNTNKNVLYTPHYSIFDLYLTECGIGLNTYDNKSINFLDKNSKIHRLNMEDNIDAYSAHIVNNLLMHQKHNNSIFFHLNTIIFAHDINIFTLKKEDMFLLCENSIRQNDILIYFPEQIKMYNCSKLNMMPMTYSIPDNIKPIENTEKSNVGVFCYNKNISDDIISSLDGNITKISTLSNSIEELNTDLNKYKIIIEFDPGSIINALTAVASGAIAFIMDPNNTLSQYRDIPNLYIKNSISELHNALKKDISYIIDNNIFNSRFRNFISFKQQLLNILQENHKKAFIL